VTQTVGGGARHQTDHTTVHNQTMRDKALRRSAGADLRRRQWSILWRVRPLTRPMKVSLLVLVAVTVIVESIRIAAGSISPSDIISLAAALLIAGFAWRPVIATVSMLALMVVALSIGAGDVWLLAMAIAGGLVAVTCSTSLTWAYAIVLLMGAVFAEGTRTDARPIGSVIVLLVVATASILIGFAFRQAGRKQAHLVKRLAASEAAAHEALRSERERIADELHDFIAHELTIISIHGRVLQRSADQAERETAQDAIVNASTQAMADVRRVLQIANASRTGAEVTWDVRHSLAQTIDDVERELQALGKRVDVSFAVTPGLSRSIDSGLAHILREATTNIVRHSELTRHVVIAATQTPDRVRLTVSNAPVGSRATPASAFSGGYGIARMRERAHLLGGELSAGIDGDTWVVAVTLPLT